MFSLPTDFHFRQESATRLISKVIPPSFKLKYHNIICNVEYIVFIFTYKTQTFLQLVIIILLNK